jgi:hypothetical protein
VEYELQLAFKAIEFFRCHSQLPTR